MPLFSSVTRSLKKELMDAKLKMNLEYKYGIYVQQLVYYKNEVYKIVNIDYNRRDEPVLHLCLLDRTISSEVVTGWDSIQREITPMDKLI